MTDSSQAAEPGFDSFPAHSARGTVFNPISIVVLAAGLWGAASLGLIWAGVSWGWALGLGYLASPILTVAAIFLADLRSRNPLALLGSVEGAPDLPNRDTTTTEAIADWEADRAADRAAPDTSHRAA